MRYISVGSTARSKTSFPIMPRYRPYHFYWKFPEILQNSPSLRVGETGVSWAGFCLMWHKFGMIKNIKSVNCHLIAQSFVYQNNIDPNQLVI